LLQRRRNQAQPYRTHCRAVRTSVSIREVNFARATLMYLPTSACSTVTDQRRNTGSCPCPSGVIIN
jgi:hypothetical protein